jgi:hypothetical protein
MKLVTLDFETYWADDFTLSKMTTEEYVRDPRFQTILMGYQIDDDPHQHHVVGHGAIATLLGALDIENSAVLCHHAHFDGLILSHHFQQKPKVWFDTLSMARALHGTEVGGSLSKLMLHYGVGEKGTDTINAKNMRLEQFSPEHLHNYGLYCRKDVKGTKDIFNKMVREFGRSELRQIDMVVRMFTEPIAELDHALLLDYAEEIQANKMTMLFEAGVTLEEVMSNEKFAEALRRVGVEPPKKLSLTTGKLTWAFAKTDKEFKDLEEHPDDRVQALVSARLGNKTTINETRAKRMADMVTRGPACFYYNYAGANQTHRLSGGDKMNWQNLQRGGKLRDAIYAPEGYALVVPDSSNIEARVLDYLAWQEDMLQIYRAYDRDPVNNPEVYCVIASRLYGREIVPSMKPERQAGKTVKLACGFQMGGDRYKETARIMGGLDITIQESQHAVLVYRQAHPMVVQLWARAHSALPVLAAGSDDDVYYLDPRGLLRVEKNAIVLPNGLRLRYPEMRFDSGTNGWSFAGRKGQRKHIYGGKLVENVVQALAKIVVMDQLTEVNYQYKRQLGYQPAIMTSHDEGVFCVPEDRADEVLAFAKTVMGNAPSWAPDLPVAAKGDIAIRYGDAK